MTDETMDTADTIRHELSLIREADRGVTKRQVLELADLIGVSLAVLAKLLSINVRTLQRKEMEARFDRMVSEHVLHVSAALERGLEVFGTKEHLMRWLQAPVAYLDHQLPIELLRSRFGTELVLSELERIEHGVF
jgi:putative toxin-antitoxin system antitoxin component (TIGR02293 family)